MVAPEPILGTLGVKQVYSLDGIPVYHRVPHTDTFIHT